MNETNISNRPALDRLAECVEHIRDAERKQTAAQQAIEAYDAALTRATTPKEIQDLQKHRSKAASEAQAAENLLAVLRPLRRELEKDPALRREAVAAVEAGYREAYDDALIRVMEAVRGLRVALENASAVMENAARVFDDYNDLGARLPRRPFGRDVGHFKGGHAALRILDALHGVVLAPADIKVNDDDDVEVGAVN